MSNVLRSFAFLPILTLLFVTAKADWPTHRGNSQRTGYREQRITATQWQPLWMNDDLDAPAPAWPAPARGSLWQRLTTIEPRVTDDRGDVPLIAADRDGKPHVIVGSSATDRLIALDPLTGKQQWQFIADAPIRYAPAIEDGTAWFGADDGKVRAIDLRDGRLLWETHVGPKMPKIVGNSRIISAHPIRTSVLVADGHVYANAGLFPSQGVYTVSLNAADGKVEWRRRTTRSPQGYLLMGEKQRLYIPCGRAAPYMIASDSGRYIADCQSAGGSFCMLTPDAFFSGPGNDRAVQSYVDLPKTRALSIGGRAIAAGGGNLWAADGSQLVCFDLKKKVFRQTDSQRWAVPCAADNSLIATGHKTSSFVFAGADNRVEVFDGNTGVSVASLATAAADEHVRYLAVAAAGDEQESDLLIATTSSGRVYCWAGRTTKAVNSPRADWPAAAESKEATAAKSGKTSSEVESRITAATNALPSEVGLALFVNDNDGQYGRELLRTSRLNVISVVSEPDVRDQLRSHFLQDRVYGERITVLHVADDQPLPFSERLFNLAMEANASKRESTELERMVDSGTGVIARTDHSLHVADSLVGGGRWRHQYGSPANTSDSGDTSVGNASAFRLQWFGGVGPSRMPDRHLRAQAPLAVGSTMVLHGDECLIGVDPANGIERWQVALPFDAMRYVIPFDAGYSCLTADGQTLYTATAAEIWKLNALTGVRSSRIPIPDAVKGMRWGYMAEQNGKLYASCMKPSAARLKGPPQPVIVPTNGQPVRERIEFDRSKLRKEYAADDYDSVRPLVCSRLLCRLHDSGRVDWHFQSAGVIPNGSISLTESGERMVFIEGLHDDCVRHETDRIAVADIVQQADVVCIDASTGDEIWRVPLGWSTARDILYTQVVDGRVVLAAAESKKSGAFYHVGVLDLADGRQVWSTEHAHITRGLGHGEQIHHPLALRQASGKVHLIAEPFMYDLETGDRVVPAGADADWSLKRPGHSCGTLSGAGTCVFFRATNPTVLNLSESVEDRFQKLSPSRPGCWINMLPVSGRLLIPEGSASCVCLFPLQTSMGFVPVTADNAATELPMLEDFPPLAEEPLAEVYAWDFHEDAVDKQTILSRVGGLPLQASSDIAMSATGIKLDGKQWLAVDLDRPELPPMPATVSLETRVTVSEGNGEWAGFIGAMQDNGSFERGALLGMRKNHIFFAVASERKPSMTFLEAPWQIEPSQPYHIVGTYDGSTMRLYINGKLTGLSTAQSGAVLFEQKSWLAAGIYKDDDEHFPLFGTLHSAAVFRGALDSEQVKKRAVILP